jgi:hypothetical protein
MRPWPESLKNTLRHLAAARYFLPVELDQGEYPDTERSYHEYLHHTEFELALDQLEFLGTQHTEDAFQPLFWEELALAAENMGMEERVADYRRRALKGG